jgi:hypothetical protein
MKLSMLSTASLLIAVAFGSGALASDVVLYDVDFSAPRFTAGTVSATGGTDAPSSLIGQPLVQSTFGGALSQSLEFRTATNRPFPGIVFDIGFPAPRYHVEFDTIIESLPTGTSQLFSLVARMDHSMYLVNEFAFRDQQRVGFFSQDSTHAFGGLYPTTGVWPLMQFMHVSADIDFANKHWTVHLDGTQVITGEFARDPGSQLTSIEFRMQALPVPQSAALVDNILITAVPEPSTLILAGLSGLMLLMLRRRKFHLAAV